MKYCIKCGECIKDETLNVCPKCEANIESNLDKAQLKELTQNAHKKEREGYDNSQNAYCFLVVGATVFIIGLIFFWLSFKNSGNATMGNSGKSLSFTCFEFYVFLAGVIAGGFCIVYGTIKAILARAQRKQYLSLIEDIRADHYNQ